MVWTMVCLRCWKLDDDVGGAFYGTGSSYAWGSRGGVAIAVLHGPRLAKSHRESGLIREFCLGFGGIKGATIGGARRWS
jgi:hypothetical protein